MVPIIVLKTSIMTYSAYINLGMWTFLIVPIIVPETSVMNLNGDIDIGMKESLFKDICQRSYYIHLYHIYLSLSTKYQITLKVHVMQPVTCITP